MGSVRRVKTGAEPCLAFERAFEAVKEESNGDRKRLECGYAGSVRQDGRGREERYATLAEEEMVSVG